MVHVYNVDCAHPLADHLPASGILTTDSVALEQDRPLEAKSHALDVNRVTGDGDSVPPATHGAIRASPCLFQTKLFL